MKFLLVQRLEAWDHQASRREKLLYFGTFSFITAALFVGVVMLQVYPGHPRSMPDGMEPQSSVKPSLINEGEEPRKQARPQAEARLNAPDTITLSREDIQIIDRMANFAVQDSTSLGELEAHFNHQKN